MRKAAAAIAGGAAAAALYLALRRRRKTDDARIIAVLDFWFKGMIEGASSGSRAVLIGTPRTF